MKTETQTQDPAMIEELAAFVEGWAAVPDKIERKLRALAEPGKLRRKLLRAKAKK